MSMQTLSIGCVSSGLSLILVNSQCVLGTLRPKLDTPSEPVGTVTSHIILSMQALRKAVLTVSRAGVLAF